MTDYTKTTDFAAKDGLPSGDSGKIIKGTEFETEFDNIATAIATKSNIASPTFTGTTTIPTVDINGGAIDAVTLGTNSAVTEAQVDNININGNTISSSDTDGNVNISPNGTGTVVINTDLDVDNINVNGNAIISTDTNGNIDLTPNGTGEVNISKVDIDAGAIDGTVIGAASAAAITATTGQFNTSLNVDGTVTADGLTVDTDTLVVDAANNRVGIGTSSPSGLLETNTTGDNFTYLRSGDANTVGIIFGNQSDSATASIQMLHSDNSLSIRGYNNAERMRIDSSGRVGIGTSSPSSVLHLSTSNDPKITLTDTGFGASADITGSNGNLRLNSQTATIFDMAGSEKIRIDASGNVGIGTTSPDSLMHLHGSPIIRMTTATTGQTATDGLIFGSNADGSSFLWTYENEHLYFGTNNTERVRITEAGNVGIGTSAIDGTLVLAAGTSGSASTGGYLGFTTGTNASKVRGAGIEAFSLTTGNDHGLRFFTNASTAAPSEAMRIDSSGNVGIGTSTNLANGTLNVESNGTSVLQARSDTAGVNDGDTTVVVSRALNSTAGKWANAIYRGYSHAWSYGNSASTSEAMRIDSNGNVGIGTTSPSAKLDTAYTDSATYSATTPSADLILSRKNTANTNNQTVGIRFDVTGWSGSTTGGAAIEAIQPSSASTADLAFLTRNAGTWGERMRIDSSGNLLVGTTARPTSSAGNIVLANGTAPTASATDGVILYAEDVSSSSGLKVRDEAGNITTLSPHNFDLIPQGPSEDMAWSYYSERDGKQINVDMLKAIRVLEKLSGEQLVFEN